MCAHIPDVSGAGTGASSRTAAFQSEKSATAQMQMRAAEWPDLCQESVSAHNSYISRQIRWKQHQPPPPPSSPPLARAL